VSPRCAVLRSWARGHPLVCRVLSGLADQCGVACRHFGKQFLHSDHRRLQLQVFRVQAGGLLQVVQGQTKINFAGRLAHSATFGEIDACKSFVCRGQFCRIGLDRCSRDPRTPLRNGLRRESLVETRAWCKYRGSEGRDMPVALTQGDVFFEPCFGHRRRGSFLLQLAPPLG